MNDLLPTGLVNAPCGVILGATKPGLFQRSYLIRDDSSHAVLVCGPPGEGKSFTIARPTLLTGWYDQSAIVFDPAFELAPMSAAYRSRSTRVLTFDPRSPTTARYNPLDGIGISDVDSVRSIMATLMFGKSLDDLPEQQRFFLGSALELGTALVSHAIELGTPSLAAAARYYYGTPWKSDKEFFESLFKSAIPYVQETGNKFALMEPKQSSPIVATLTQQLDIFRSPDIEHATSTSDFQAEDLRRSPTTLYLVAREKDQAAFGSIMRLVLTRLLDDLTETLPRNPNNRILLLCDEFPLLRAPMLEGKIATLRKYHIKPVLLVQSIAQIRAYYGNNESLSELGDVQVFFPTSDSTTQEFASRLCGGTTCMAESVSHDRNGRQTRSVHEAQRPLLYPNDLAMMKATGEILIYKKGVPPIRALPSTYAME